MCSTSEDYVLALTTRSPPYCGLYSNPVIKSRPLRSATIDWHARTRPCPRLLARRAVNFIVALRSNTRLEGSTNLDTTDYYLAHRSFSFRTRSPVPSSRPPLRVILFRERHSVYKFGRPCPSVDSMSVRPWERPHSPHWPEELIGLLQRCNFDVKYLATRLIEQTGAV